MAVLDEQWVEEWAAEYRRVMNGLGRISVVEAPTPDIERAREQHRVRLLESRLSLVKDALRQVAA